MTDVTAYSIDGPEGRFEKTTISRREPGPTEIYIEIQYAGICHSDIHTARSEWGPARYPLVPGHEIAGVVARVGSDVTRHKVGDRVGIGVAVDSCRECEECLAGYDNFCLGSGGKAKVMTYNSIGRDGLPTAGGYSTGITVEEDFAVRIPDAIPMEKAAPLLCAGVTTYSPLKRWGAGPGKRVGVVGVGGLGHMAVQIAAKMGAEVIGLGRTLAKADDALALGATDYVATTDDDAMAGLEGRFDIIISSVSDGLDLDLMVRLLKTRGVLVEVGLPTQPATFRIGALVGRNKVIAGSNVGSLSEMQETLDFCAEHGIASWVEVIGGDGIDQAYEDVIASKARYRYVLDVATFDA